MLDPSNNKGGRQYQVASEKPVAKGTKIAARCVQNREFPRVTLNTVATVAAEVTVVDYCRRLL